MTSSGRKPSLATWRIVFAGSVVYSTARKQAAGRWDSRLLTRLVLCLFCFQ